MNLRDHLQTIYDEHGKLTPKLVVDEARDPKHPLHNRFEWDDGIAAERYREEQARGLIRLLRVGYRNADGDQGHVRSYHSVRTQEGYSYEPVEKIIESPMLTKILLADMRRDWQALKRRYERFEEFARMIRNDLDAA
jgi:hypothetical protein